MRLAEYQDAIQRLLGAKHAQHHARMKTVPVERRGGAIVAEALILAGRVGSITEAAGHAQCSPLDEEIRAVLVRHLGGVLGVVARMCEALEVPLEVVAKQNLEELAEVFESTAVVPLELACPRCSLRHTNCNRSCDSMDGGFEHSCVRCTNAWRPYAFQTTGSSEL